MEEVMHVLKEHSPQPAMHIMNGLVILIMNILNREEASTLPFQSGNKSRLLAATLTRDPQSTIQKSHIAYTVFQKVRVVSTVVQSIPISVY